MKALIVANAFPKFSETFIRDHAIGLLQNNIDVAILVDYIDMNEYGALKGFESYDLVGKTKTINNLLPKSVFSKLFKALLITALSKNQEKCMSFGAFLYSLLNNGLRRTIHNVHILNFINLNDIDIVHAHFGNNGERMSFLQEYNVKVFTTFHGYDIRAGLEQGGRIYGKLIASKSPIISISDYNRKSLISMGFDQANILDIANGVDTEFFKKQNKDHGNSVVKMITVARLSPQKGLDIALKALKLFHSKNANLDIEYKLIGEGEQRMELELLIKDLKLDNVVKLLGAKSSSETRSELLASNIFLLPSRAEALPTVLLEAQSAELAILATDVGSVKSMLKSGILVKPDSVDDFMIGLDELYKKKEKWGEMGKIGREYIIENHNLDNQINRIIGIYKTDQSL